jgi:hypothetical protein
MFILVFPVKIFDYCWGPLSIYMLQNCYLELGVIGYLRSWKVRDLPRLCWLPFLVSGRILLALKSHKMCLSSYIRVYRIWFRMVLRPSNLLTIVSSRGIMTLRSPYHCHVSERKCRRLMIKDHPFLKPASISIFMFLFLRPLDVFYFKISYREVIETVAGVQHSAAST